MPMKDYYSVLGVDKAATSDQIKSAYRKLAKEFHPDRNKDKGAEAKFTEINEAYDVLGDDDKRRKYDNVKEQARTGTYRAPNGAYSSDVNWDEVLSNIFGWEGGSYAASHGAGRRGFSFNSFSRGNADDPFFGDDGIYTRQGGRQPQSLDVVNNIRVTMKEAFEGAKRTISINGREKTVFQIPRMSPEGTVITLPGMGNANDRNERGDRRLVLEIETEPGVTLSGGDITVERDITPWDAALGTKIVVAPLSDEISVNVKPGARSGMKLRVPRQGFVDKRGNRGDLFVKLTIQNPSVIPSDILEAYKKHAAD